MLTSIALTLLLEFIIIYVGSDFLPKTRGMSAGGAGFRMFTGSYTGDGNATLAITGVGFQPRMVVAYGRIANTYYATKLDVMLLNTHLLSMSAGAEYMEADHIISLDADGFTVGDGTGGVANVMNVAAQAYTYTCWG